MDAGVEEAKRQSESGKVFDEVRTDLLLSVSRTKERVPSSLRDSSPPVGDTDSLSGCSRPPAAVHSSPSTCFTAEKILEPERSSLSPRSSPLVEKSEFAAVDRGESGRSRGYMPENRTSAAVDALLETLLPAGRTCTPPSLSRYPLEKEGASRTSVEDSEFLISGAASKDLVEEGKGAAPVEALSSVQTPEPKPEEEPSGDPFAGSPSNLVDSNGAGKPVTRFSVLETTSRQSTAGSPVEVVRCPAACRPHSVTASSCSDAVSGTAEDGTPFSLASQMESLEEVNCAEVPAAPAPPAGNASGGPGPGDDDGALGEASLQASALPTSVGGSEEAFGVAAWRQNASDRDTAGTHSAGEKEAMKEEKGEDMQGERVDENGDPSGPVKRRKKEDEDGRFSLSSSTFPAPSLPAKASPSPSQLNSVQNASSSQHPPFEQGSACHASGWTSSSGPLHDEEQTDQGSDALAASLSSGQSCPGPARGAAMGGPGRVPVAGEKYAQWLDAIYTVCLKIDDLCAKLDPDFPNAMALWEQRGPGIDGARSLFMNGGCPLGGYGAGGIDPSQRAFDGVGPGDVSPPFGGIDDYSGAGASQCSGPYALGASGAPSHALSMPGSGWPGPGSLKKRGRKDRPPAGRQGAGATSPSSLSSLFGPRASGLLPLSNPGQTPHMGGNGPASSLLQLQGRDGNGQLGVSLSNDMFGLPAQRGHLGSGGVTNSAGLGAGGGRNSMGSHAGMLGNAGAGGSSHASHFPSHVSSQLLSPSGGRERADPVPASAPESEYEYLLHLPEQEGPNPENATDLKCDVAGVYWDKRSWIASWYEGGKRYYKSFSAKTHGFYRSKYWAIKVRLSKVQNSNLLVNKGSKNKDRGGASNAAAHAAVNAGYGGRNQTDDASGYR
uniref:AP2 domain transcription factor AP2XI-5 n=2 Tax=Neospora caninum (strain Liverpool) TaxID=572307 RepID=A0A0F7UQC4_NEOCL|nr:TPA: AP2 domain transcription factor AP2XI-5 [Neospora caninum Liverpool]